MTAVVLFLTAWTVQLAHPSCFHSFAVVINCLISYIQTFKCEQFKCGGIVYNGVDNQMHPN